MVRKVICAVDTGEVSEALELVKKLSPHVGAFKIGHALTLQNGLEVIKLLQDAGARRVFLDLKFHDIPNSVALAVRQAAQYNVWMMTLHISGGPAMMTAASEEAASFGEDAPCLMGVSVLTSLDQHVLTDHLGIQRGLGEHMAYLSQLAVDCGLDGVISSAQEVKQIREKIGHNGLIVTPGIRAQPVAQDDQKRVGTAMQAIQDGADYVVIGRALTDASDPVAALVALGFDLAHT